MEHFPKLNGIKDPYYTKDQPLFMKWMVDTVKSHQGKKYVKLWQNLDNLNACSVISLFFKYIKYAPYFNLTIDGSGKLGSLQDHSNI